MFKTQLAFENWMSKYRYQNEEPIDTFRRVAKALAAVEKKKDREMWEDRFLRTLVKFSQEGIPVGLKATTGGRITANIGTGYKHATLMNCFINGPVSGAKIKYSRKTFDNKLSHDITYNSDDSPDDLINIFLTLLEQAKTLASEGGYGINFDFIRPRGALIKGTGIFHPGIVSYMKVWDSVSECIVKGIHDGYTDKLKNYLGEEDFEKSKDVIKAMTRKGAMMGVLPVSHPDIEEFVRAKQTSGVLTKFNISVLIDDKFMEAVINDTFYDLTFKDKVYKRVKARDLYNLIMESTYNRAEPGVIFVDNMHRNNPLSYLGKANATNPCFSKDMYVYSKTGVHKIEDNIGKPLDILQDCRVKLIDPEKEIFEVLPKESGFRYTPSQSGLVLTRENAKTIKTTLKSHFKPIVSTENHRFFTKKGAVKAKDLRVGDEVLITYQDYPSMVETPLDGLAFLLGLIDGDGGVASCPDKYCVFLDFWGEDRHNLESQVKHIIEGLYDLYGEHIKTKRERDISPYYVSYINKSNKIRIGSSFLYHLLKDKFNWSGEKRDIPKLFFNTSRTNKYAKNYIAGLFYSDGTVSITPGRVSARISQSDETYLEDIGVLLFSLGIGSSVLKRRNKHNKRMPDGRGGTRVYACKEQFELIIYKTHFERFYRITKDLFQNKKTEIIKNNIKCRNKRKEYLKVKSIKEHTTQDVYCLKEDKYKNMVVNGCSVARCGEIPGLPTLTTVCLLGSLNLTQYIVISNGKPVFDYESFKADVITFSRMLDNVNDITYNSLPSYDWATKNVRQFGMGLNGLGSSLLMLGVPYNSKEAVAFVKELCDIKENLTWQTSARLAEEKGTFPAYDKKKFESTEYFKSDRLWPETKKLLRKHGARNGKTTTNPPLGNSSIICDVVSNGIEPVFMLEYERKSIVKNWPEGLDESNIKSKMKYYKENDYEYWRGEYGDREYYYEPHNRGLCEVTAVRDYGYQWLLDNMPDKDHSKYLVTTRDLTVDDHINIQEVVQYHCNQSVSKTSNLPSNYPFSSFKDLYTNAWKKGLNGFTTYREGSMESVMSDVAKAEETKEIIKRDIKLPDVFNNGPTSIIKREGKKFYIHFSYLPEDSEMTFPVAMWIYSNNKYKEKDELKVCNKAARNLAKLALKSNVDGDIVQDAIDKSKTDFPHNRLGRLISLCLRHHIPREDILVDLIGIDGDNVSTLLTAVRKFLSGTLKDGTSLRGIQCEECGSESIVLEGGCKKCIDCGFSGCG